MNRNLWRAIFLESATDFFRSLICCWAFLKLFLLVDMPSEIRRTTEIVVASSCEVVDTIHLDNPLPAFR
jgi:hypothetical protein